KNPTKDHKSSMKVEMPHTSSTWMIQPNRWAKDRASSMTIIAVAPRVAAVPSGAGADVAVGVGGDEIDKDHRSRRLLRFRLRPPTASIPKKIAATLRRQFAPVRCRSRKRMWRTMSK